eukprot:TRINITY_DN434_c0_g2_i1.p2 TRINITY_DN434_c0_g2~~TRINITY_DN434_c0_g2_i1.p2  ORF type:complete len:689 (+),score=109.99 TRINITY_DN434_c0_g2_i1:9267-11333(+)
MDNGSPNKKESAYQRTMATSASAPYLNSCNQVELEAYNRLLDKLKVVSHIDEATDSMQNFQRVREELIEKQKKEKLKKELMQTTQYLRKQMEEKAVREKTVQEKDREEYNKVCNSMPAYVVSVFPRITETPLEVRRQREINQKITLKKGLLEQIGEREARVKKEKQDLKELEQGRLKRLVEMLKKEEEEIKEKQKEKREKYIAELKKDIECKTMEKANQKRLDTIEYDGMKKIVALNDEKAPLVEANEYPLPEDEVVEPAEENVDKGEIEVIENFFNAENAKEESEAPPPETDDKLAQLIAKKQQKANELLKKIEELEKRGLSGRKSSLSTLPIKKLKTALMPEGYRYSSTTGKEARITSEEANKMVAISEGNRSETRSVRSVTSRAKSQRDIFALSRHSTGFGNTAIERAQKVAYERYIAQLEHQVLFKNMTKQANEEQRRILDSLKREQKSAVLAKQKEEEKKTLKAHNRDIILEQMNKLNEKRKTEIRFAKSIPHIFGNQGYPPIYEPSPEQLRDVFMRTCQNQREALLKQVLCGKCRLKYNEQIKDNSEIKKKEREGEIEKLRRTGWVNKDMKVEENMEKTAAWKKKLEEQKKWKEIWDGQAQIRQLRASIERTMRPTQFMSPSHQRSVSNGNLAKPKSRAHNLFITSGEDTGNYIKPSELYRSVNKLQKSNDFTHLLLLIHAS